MMKNYVISLTTASERRDHIIREFGKQGVDFEFFDAVTPEQVDNLAERYNINVGSCELTKGELACLFSHLSLWHKALGENMDYIAIFEDDVYLGNNSHLYLGDAKWIPKNIDTVKLEFFQELVDMDFTGLKLPGNRKLRKINSVHLGAAGYILNTHSINKFLNIIKSYQQIIPIDHVLFDSHLKEIDVFQMHPAIVVQSDRVNTAGNNNINVFKSQLEADRRIRINNSQISENILKNELPYTRYKRKIIREIHRIIAQVTTLTNTVYRHFFSKSKFR